MAETTMARVSAMQRFWLPTANSGWGTDGGWTELTLAVIERSAIELE